MVYRPALTVRPILLFAAVAIAAAPAIVAQAQDNPGGGVPDAFDVQTLLEELRATQQEVKSLTREVHELRAENGDNWMTEKRANEIRSIVGDVLADADQRASLLQGGMTAGWDNGFFLSSNDGNFLLALDGQIQFRWIYNWHNDTDDNHRQGFEIPRAKLTFRGHIMNRDLTYLIRMDQTRNEPSLVNGLYFLQDAWVRYQLTDNMALRFGQFKLPFGREELVASSYQLAVERSLLNENTNLGRSQGVEFQYDMPNARFAVAISDGATDNLGGFNAIIEPGGAPLNSSALTRDVELTATARVDLKLAGTWEQFADFTSPPDDPFGLLVGGAFHYELGEHGTAGADDEEEWFGVTFDVSAEFGGANLFASAVYHHVDSNLINNDVTVEAYGFVLQGGYYFTENIEVFGRYEWGQFMFSAANFATPTLNVATIGVNYYLNPERRHDAKITADIGFSFDPIARAGSVSPAFASDLAGYREDSRTSEHQIVFRLQYQLRF
ncbi:MAG: porin [Phycisphaerales bacterium]